MFKVRYSLKVINNYSGQVMTSMPNGRQATLILSVADLRQPINQTYIPSVVYDGVRFTAPARTLVRQVQAIGCVLTIPHQFSWLPVAWNESFDFSRTVRHAGLNQLLLHAASSSIRNTGGTPQEVCRITLTAKEAGPAHLNLTFEGLEHPTHATYVAKNYVPDSLNEMPLVLPQEIDVVPTSIYVMG